MAFQAAQAVLVPVLVDRQRCDAATTDAVKNMMLMNPPSAFSVRPMLSPDSGGGICDSANGLLSRQKGS